MYFDVIMAGFGGQGIQVISQIVALAAIRKGLNVTYLPSYGVEKRGGRTNVTMVVADEEIGSPVINRPVSVIAMDGIALEKYQPMIAAQGLLIANTSLIPPDLIRRDDIDTVRLQCNDEAVSLGDTRLASMIALGSFIERSRILGTEDIENTLPRVIPERLKETIPLNLKAFKRGMELSANGH